MEVDGHEEEGAAPTGRQSAYVPGQSRPLKDDETLEFDKTAYRMFRQFQTTQPCLSFDPIRDDEGDERETYPANAFLVAGTQADKARDNAIVTIKLQALKKLKQDKDEDDSDASSSSDEESEEEEENMKTDKKTGKASDPEFKSAVIPHHGGVNRIRASRLSATSCVVAVWNDAGKVQLWNLAASLSTVSAPGAPLETKMKNEKPLHTFAGHANEGYALDWSSTKIGSLATGDNAGRIHLWEMGDGGVWAVSGKPYSQHESSVEDVQWSPAETTVLASVSSDRTIRLWDTRVAPAQANVCTLPGAHTNDINVLSWNTLDPNLLLTGGDDHCIRVWDIRRFGSVGERKETTNMAVATFTHHTKPITSVHWCPHDSTTFAATGDDHQTSVWDVAMERESGETTTETKITEEEDVPAQLLFVHMGQKHVKEVRWHPQLKGTLLTTSHSGFDIFRTISV